MNYRFLTVLLFCGFISCPSLISQEFPDSLKAAIKKAGSPVEEKAKAATELATFMFNTHHDSAEYYTTLAMALSSEARYLPGIFDNSCTLGKLNLRRDSLDKALEIFEEARKYMEEIDDKRDALCVLLLTGYVYDIRKELYKAHLAYYEGLQIAEEANDSAFLWSFYNNLGAHYYEMADYDNSIKMLRMGLQVYERLAPSQRKYSLASTLNNIAGSFLDLGEPDSALVYLERAREMPDLEGEYYGLYNIYGNLGKVFLLKDEPEKALEQFRQAGAALDSLKGNFKGSMAPLYATQYRHLGEVHYRLGNLGKSREYFLNALQYSDLSSEIVVKSEALLSLSKIEEQSGDIRASHKFLKEYLTVRDTLLARKADEKIAQITLRYQFEKDLKAKEYEMKMNELRHRRRELWYLFVLITTVGILITLFLLYRLQRNKARRQRLEEKTARLEKEKIAEELDYKNKELATNVLYLLKKNEFIASISQKLENVLDRLKEDDAKSLRSIIAELEKTKEDDTWQEFEIRFKEVHTQFYNRLSHQFPDLTAQDLRLCAFLRLNMTNKEIAAITYQSLDSLKTARYRLRKKMGMDRDENLVAFLTRV